VANRRAALTDAWAGRLATVRSTYRLQRPSSSLPR